MALEENLQKLRGKNGLAEKHPIALAVLDEILQNITGQQPEQARTAKGTKVSYGAFWYWREQTIKVAVPESGNVMRDVAGGLDAAADTIETVLLTGAPKNSCIPVYCSDGDVAIPSFSLVFGFTEPKIFVPGAADGLQGSYLDIIAFLRDYKTLLFA